MGNKRQKKVCFITLGEEVIGILNKKRASKQFCHLPLATRQENHLF